MDLKDLLRKNVRDFISYTPGEQPSDGDWIKLNTNENPYPPVPEIMEDIKNSINETLRKYPDPMAYQLREMIVSKVLKDKYNITDVDSIFIGSGSDEVLDVIFKTFIDENDEIILYKPSYGMYKVLSDLYNGKIIEITLNENFCIPQTEMDLKGKLFIINSPNNPTGNSFSNDNIYKVCKNFPGIVVVDEAYADFSNTSALSLLKEFNNLIITRTFSKSFSLASLRIAFAVANPLIVKELNKVKLPYNTSYISQIAAIYCLKHINKILPRTQKIIAQREYVIKQLNKNTKIKAWPSDSNFILIEFPNEKLALNTFEALKKEKILVRFFNKNGLRKYIRVSIGTKEENFIFLKTFNQISEKFINS